MLSSNCQINLASFELQDIVQKHQTTAGSGQSVCKRLAGHPVAEEHQTDSTATPVSESLLEQLCVLSTYVLALNMHSTTNTC